jgi:hypothetical protein
LKRALAGLALAACGGTTVDALDGPGSCATTTGEVARVADEVVDSLGVKPTELRASDPIVRERLFELGARFILLDWEVFRDDVRMLADSLGLRGMITLEHPEEAAAALALFGNHAVAIGFRYNTPVTPGWGDEVRANQKRLHDLAKSSPDTNAVEVVGPNVESDAQIAAVGDLSAWVDVGAFYPAALGVNDPPGARAVADIERHRPVYPGRPLIVPQTSYSTGPGGVSEAVQAKYLTRLVLEHFRLGVRRSYVQSLTDGAGDAAAGASTGFGLVHADGTPKPSFRGLARLLALLADAGPSFSPGRLTFTIANASSDVHRLLLQKRNGVFYLVLWREVPSTDDDATESVDVAIGSDVRAVNAYAPLASSAPVLHTTSRAFTLAVPDAPVVVVIDSSCR